MTSKVYERGGPDDPNRLISRELVDPIWERQPEETAKHYAMFLQYAALKPSERTYSRAWKVWTADSAKDGKPISEYYRRLAASWKWLERAAAKDLFDAQNMQAKWIERDKERRENAYEIGGRLLRQSQRALDIIDRVDDDNLVVSLGDAKDMAMAGAQLQAAAVPTIQLAQDQMQWLLSVLPAEKRRAVIERLIEVKTERLMLPGNVANIDNSAIIEGEYQVAKPQTEE